MSALKVSFVKNCKLYHTKVPFTIDLNKPGKPSQGEHIGPILNKLEPHQHHNKKLNIRCFVAKSAVSRFTRFLVSNFELEMSAGVNKLTNIRY